MSAIAPAGRPGSRLRSRLCLWWGSDRLVIPRDKEPRLRRVSGFGYAGWGADGVHASLDSGPHRRSGSGLVVRLRHRGRVQPQPQQQPYRVRRVPLTTPFPHTLPFAGLPLSLSEHRSAACMGQRHVRRRLPPTSTRLRGEVGWHEIQSSLTRCITRDTVDIGGQGHERSHGS
jgi:hypothetical protein